MKMKMTKKKRRVMVAWTLITLWILMEKKEMSLKMISLVRSSSAEIKSFSNSR